jgi:hypothetical protein
MGPEKPEIGLGKLSGTETVGQPIVQKKERVEEKEHTEEKEQAGQPPRTITGGMPGTDQVGPDATVTRKKAGKKRGTEKKPGIAHPVTEVYRKTEMFGMSTKSFPEEPAHVRRRTEQNIKNPEFGIPYAATEKAVRDLVCSLVERQDRMNAGLFLDINCMQEDIGMLKDQVYKLKITNSGPIVGERK